MMNFIQKVSNRILAFALVLFLSVISLNSYGQYSGTFTIGGAAPWTTLTSALAALHTTGVSGNVTLLLPNGYTGSGETFPLQIQSVAGTSATVQVTIEPALGATATITGSSATAILEFVGCQYVAIDGRPGGTGGSTTTTGSAQITNALQISNTNTAGVATIEFLTDARYDTLKYCNVMGSSVAHGNGIGGLGGGVIYIGQGVTNGNDNNVITNCDVHAAGSNAPMTCIAGYNTAGIGTAKDNDNVAILYNNIYGFNVPSSTVTADTTAGIFIGSGNNSYTIKGNSIYETSSISVGSSTAVIATWFGIIVNAGGTTGNLYGGGYNISNNYIGSSSPQVFGAAVNSSPMTLTSPGSLLHLYGMLLSLSNTTASTISNNQISNISLTTPSVTAGGQGTFDGIAVSYGNVTLSHNIIGLPSSYATTPTTSNITINMTGTGGSAVGINLAGNNISVSGATVTGNLVNSMTMVGTATTTAGTMPGFFIATTTSGVTVSSDTVSFLNYNNGFQKVATSWVGGMLFNGAITNLTIKNNVLHDISHNGEDSIVAVEPAAFGITFLNGTATNNTITGNIIYNITNGTSSLSETYPGYNTMVAGMFLNVGNGGYTTISNNLISNIDVPMWQPTATATANPTVYGIYLDGGADSLINNMIDLGYNISGGSSSYPITFTGIAAATGTSGAAKVWAYYNSVYIGGSATHNTSATTATGSYSSAFANLTATTLNIQDNIFENARTSTGTGSLPYNYCITFPTAAASIVLNYNDYYYPGGNPFAYKAAANIAAWSTNWYGSDASSVITDPLYSNPTGAFVTSGTLNLDLSSSSSGAAGTGTVLTSFPATKYITDIHGTSRTAADMGADFIALPNCATPGAQPTTLVLTPAPTSISGSFTASATAPIPTGYLVVQYPSGTTVGGTTAPVNFTTYTNGTALGAGTVVGVGAGTTFTSTGLALSTNYVYFVYSYITGACIGPEYLTTSPLSGNASTISACGQVGSVLSGTVPVGPGQANNATGFTSITNAINWISVYGMSAATTLSLQSGYNGTSTNESFPIIIGPYVCPTQPLTIQQAAGVSGLQIVSNLTDAIALNGVSNVTIDGRVSTGSYSATTSGYQVAGSLLISNTYTPAYSTIRMINGAQSNTIEYCNLEGANTSARTGVVYIDAATATVGNNNNTIQNCDIHASSSFPLAGIGSYNSAATENSGNSILYNNIYDFSTLATTADTAAGIILYKGNNTYTISNNSIYESASTTMSGASIAVAGILINADPTETASANGSGFTISNNYIGGNAASCSGTMTLIGSSACRFWPMHTVFGTGTQSTISANTISNIAFTTAATALGTPGTFAAISVPYGNFAITNNNIGSATANSITVTLTASGATTNGLSLGGPGAAFTIPVTGNTINNMTVTSATPTIYGSLCGMYLANTTSTVNISNNTISNLTDGPANGTVTSSGQALGIYENNTGTNTYNYSGNTIHDIVANEPFTYGFGGDYTACAVGIDINAASGTNTISGNTIYNILNGGNTNTNTSYYPYVAGIVENTSTCTVSGNLVYSIDVPKWQPSAAPTSSPSSVMGIDLYQANTATITNNMVRLGINNAGTSNIYPVNFYGINIGFNNYGTDNVWFNSVYIGGAETAAAGTPAVGSYFTAALLNAAGGTTNFRDNILDNARTSSSGYPYNYTIDEYSDISALTLNYNDYYYPGSTSTGNYFAINSVGANLATWTSGWKGGDANSVTGNPLYNAPIGAFTTSNPLNLDINTGSAAIASGVVIGSVTTDYHGTSRSAVGIGADFIVPLNCTAPASATALTWGTIGTTSIAASFTGSSASGYLVVQYTSPLGTVTAPTNLTSYNVGGSALGGTIVSNGAATSFTATGLALGATYYYYIYAYNSGPGCIGPIYSGSLSGSNTTIGGCGTASALTGTIPVGPTHTANDQTGFTNLTNALAWINNWGMSAATILELQSDYVSAGTYPEAFPITIIALPCTAHPLTIRPASGATGLSITSANTTATIQFSGASNVTIDGRPGGAGGSATTSGYQVSGALQIINTNTSALAAVEFLNDATSNMLEYCNVQGSSTLHNKQPVSGVVFIGAGITTGNDNNTIQYCDIHNSSAGAPVNGVGAWNPAGLTTVEANDNDIIKYNNIYGFSPIIVTATNDTSAAIFFGTGNNSATISNNAIYEPSTISLTGTISSANVVAGMIIMADSTTATGVTYGSGYTISNNYIGSSSPQTVPSTATTSPMTITGTTSTRFYGFWLALGYGTASVVNGNQVSNIALITSGANTAGQGEFVGLVLITGNSNLTNNIIGLPTTAAVTNTTGNITVTLGGTTGSINGITLTSAVNTNITMSGNTINSITVNASTGPAVTATLAGMYIAMNTSAFSPVVGGTSANLGNTISYLNLNNGLNTATNSWVTGIYSSVGLFGTTVQNNMIHDISQNALYSATLANINVAASGIMFTGGGSFSNNILNNTIYNITNGNYGGSSIATAGYNTSVAAIFINGSTGGTTKISNNLIYGLDVPLWQPASATAASNAFGVYLYQGSYSLTNNMISLGMNTSGTAGAASTYPISFDGIGVSSALTGTLTVEFNSIYIGGAETGATSAAVGTGGFTACLYNASTTSTLVIEDNIFDNARTSSSGSPKNFDFVNPSATIPTTTLNYNAYYYPGSTATGNNFAYRAATTTAAWSSGWASGDVNSKVGNPQFANPTGNTSNISLAINYGAVPGSVADANGLAIGTITTDFFGNVRANLTPTDIGANAFVSMNAGNNGPAFCAGSTLTMNDTIYGTIPSGTTFSWSGPNSFTSSIQNPSISNISTAAAGTYYVTATFPGGVVETDSTIVTSVFSHPTASFSGASPISMCSGFSQTLTVAFTGTGPWTYSIDTIGGIINGTTSTSPVSFAMTASAGGTIKVISLSDVNCTATYADLDSVILTVIPSPTVVITNPSTACLPSTADLTASAVTAGSTSGLTFTYWTDAAATISYSTPTAASAGTYYIKGTTALGCYNIQPVTVTSASPPAATASSAGTYIPGQTINLVSGPSGQTSYAWSGPSAFTASSQNVSRTNAASTMSGTYTVTVTNSSGCSATASTVVVVNGLGDYTWTGATNTNWATVTNWTPTAPVGGPSGCSQNVIIPVVTNYPVISTATSIARITMNSGAQLTLNANLSVCQTFVGGTTSAATIIGTGHLVMAGTGAQTMSGLCNVDYLEINHTSTGLVSTATFNINKAMIMTKGAFSNNGSITLVSNASGDAYLDNFTSTTAGSMSNSLSVQRYIGNVADGYRDLSSPVATSVNDLNTAFPVFGQDNVDCWYAYSPYPNVQIFKEPLIIATGNFYEHWLSYTSLTKPLTAMIGYSARTYKGTPFTITFKGSAYNGAKSISITHTTSATPTSDGWNLLGNPYPSPIQWSLVKAMNGAVANGSYYVYHTTGEFTGNWGSYNGTTGVNGVTDLIAIGQGFFIQTATSGTFTMNNTVRTTGSASFYRTRALDNEIRLTLSKGVNSDEIVTYTEPGATAGFDADLDAQKIAAGSAVSIGYSLSGRDYAINAMDVITEQTVLPLTISGKETGSYTLTATTINVPGLTAYLLDSKTGSLTDLSTTASVQLSLTGGQTYAGRYSVVFQSNSASTGITATEASKTHIYAYGNQVHVIRSSANPATISVTNLLGQEIKEIPTNTEKTVFELPAVQPWYAIIKVTEGDKTTVSKVIISNN